MIATRALMAIAMMTAPAAAESTQVFPLAAQDLPPQRRGTPERLTQAIADAMDAELSSVSIEDAAGLLDCDVEATSCLEAVSRKVGGKQLVFGTIAMAKGNRLRVTLTRFRPEGPDRQQQTYELTGQSGSLPEELVRKAQGLIGPEGATPPPDEPDDQDPRPVDPDEDPDEIDPITPVDTVPVEPGRPGGTITPGTYAILAGGAVALGAGIGFRLSASSIADQVNGAPRGTSAEVAALVALEDKGRFRLQFGTALMVGGGIALVAGAVRAYVQKQPPSVDDDGAVAVIPVTGGAAITLTWGLR